MLTSLWRSTSDKGSPRHAWKNQKFDDLITTAGKTADEKTRIGLYQQAERILVEDVGAVFLSHQVIAQVWWPYIAGIPTDNQGLQVYRWLDTTIYSLYIRSDVAKWRTPH